VIEQFAWREARLLTLASDNDGRKTVEVTHEALIEHWQRLHEWLGESREDIRFQRRLEEAAQYWDGNGRPAGSLWRRPNLDILENYKHRANQDMTPLQLDFSKASFAANQRRKVLIGAGIGTLVGFAGLTSLFAVNSQRSERKAIARQLAVKSEQIGTNNSDESRIISALLAVEASRTYTNENAAMIEVDQALRNSLKLIAEKNQNPERNDSESATRRNCETSSYKIMAANSGFIAAVNSENSRSDFVCIWSISISDRWHIVPINRFEFTSGRISALDVNGMAIAIASDDSTIQLWHADRAEKTTHFEHGSSVNSVAFSPDGNYIATAGDDNIVRLWDIESEKIVTHFEHRSSVNSVAFSPDGKHIATIINDNLVQLWDVNRKEKITRFKHEGGVNSVAFSPDGDQIFVGDGKSVKIWNLHRDEEPVSLDIQYEFDSMDFISEYMIFGGTRNGIRIWDLDSEREMFRIPFNDNGFFLSLGDSDREKNEGVIQLPITKGCNEPNFFSNKDYGDINIRGYYQPLISPDDRRILTYENGTLKIWDTENCENITQVNLRRHLELEKNLYIDELIFSPNSEFIAILVSNENSNNSEEHKILVWDTIQGVKKLKLSYEQEIRSIRFSPDGKSIGFTDLDNELVQILSIDGGNEIARFAHENIRRLVFSPDGKKAATDGWDDVVVYGIWKAIEKSHS
jgi:WD40 repeat protein